MDANASYQPCFLIPCYNHGSTMAAVLESLQPYDLSIIVVDDGSELATERCLREFADAGLIELLRLDVNQGKGGAVKAGLAHAHQLGFSHAIQIDADGQHDMDALPSLLAASQQQPEKLISGCPVYDESVPKARRYGRYATHIWVWIETLSFAIKDSMCGFRAYPLAATMQLLERTPVGSRMDFDIEILVRLYWQGVEMAFVETRVIYPEGGISHFDALWDNVKISWMHTRLFFGMLPRIPSLLRRNHQHRKLRKQEGGHWSKRQEQGTVLGIRTMLWIHRLLGRPVFELILKLVMCYYYVRGGQARQASEAFLARVERYADQQGITLPSPLSSYQHLLSFGRSMLDKLAAWQGHYQMEDLTIEGAQHVEAVIEQGKGIVILGSHLGNIELCRALSRNYANVTVNALVFTEHAERFNAVMKAVNPSSDLNLIQVSSLGPDTAIMLEQKIAQGEWVVIVGDRTSTTQESRVVWADFLGEPAPFPQGPFLLASILKAPVFLLFGLRDERSTKPHFNVYFEPFSEQIVLPRKERLVALQQVVERYAQRLAHFTLQAPLQWYNFFDFWTLEPRNDNKDN